MKAVEADGRRYPRRLATILAAIPILALAAVGLTAMLGAARHSQIPNRPVAPGGVGGVPVGRARNTAQTGLPGQHGYEISYRDREPFEILTSIHNSSHDTVSIRAISFPALLPADPGFLQPQGTLLGPTAGPHQFDGSVTAPFRPFRLHPGQDRLIVLRGTLHMSGCYAAGVALTPSGLRVHWTGPWWTGRTDTVPFAEPISLEFDTATRSC